MHQAARSIDGPSSQKGRCLEAGFGSVRHDAESDHVLQGILRSKKPEALDEWIVGAIDTELTAIIRFASVLRRDIDAVKNAIELPWSNGQAEGQINRLKTLKRAMYGRAGPELMRARMLPLNHRL